METPPECLSGPTLLSYTEKNRPTARDQKYPKGDVQFW